MSLFETPSQPLLLRNVGFSWWAVTRLGSLSEPEAYLNTNLQDLPPPPHTVPTTHTREFYLLYSYIFGGWKPAESISRLQVTLRGNDFLCRVLRYRTVWVRISLYYLHDYITRTTWRMCDLVGEMTSKQKRRSMSLSGRTRQIRRSSSITVTSSPFRFT